MAKQNDSTDILTVMVVNEDSSNALRGKRVSFTGHMGMTRDEMVKFIEAHGGVYDVTPRYGTTYLVSNGDWNKGSTATEKAGSSKPKSRKAIAAEQLGVKIISEKQLLELVEQGQAREKAAAKATGT